MTNKGRHALVTGGAGFIGSHLAGRLLGDGWRVTVLDNLSNGYLDNIPEGAVFSKGDVTSGTDLNGLPWEDFDAVCHLAAQSSGAQSFADPNLDMRSHVIATFNILQRCREHGIGHVLYASSSTLYGEPDSLPVPEDAPARPTMYYSAGKAACEQYLRLFANLGVDHTIFRMPNVYGPGQNLDNMLQGMVSIYLSFMLRNEPVTIKGSLERVRDFIYIDDVVSAWACALENPAGKNRTFNLGSGVGSSVDDVIQSLKRAWGDPDYPVVVEEGTPGDQTAMILDIRRIRWELGFQPKYDLNSGIHQMVSIEKRSQSHES